MPIITKEQHELHSNLEIDRFIMKNYEMYISLIEKTIKKYKNR